MDSDIRLSYSRTVASSTSDRYSGGIMAAQPKEKADQPLVILTASQENYLEWIYRGVAADKVVRTRDLAVKLGVKLPSVSRAVAQLAAKGLVRHESYGVIELTDAGVMAGRGIVRRDECLTRLLVEVLGMSETDADPEVHRLEHVLADEVLQRFEVLVDFATSSEAWLKRLHHRISLLDETNGGGGAVAVGRTSVHAGSSSEKSDTAHRSVCGHRKELASDNFVSDR